MTGAPRALELQVPISRAHGVSFKVMAQQEPPIILHNNNHPPILSAVSLLSSHVETSVSSACHTSVTTQFPDQHPALNHHPLHRN